MSAWGYEFYLLVLKISHSFAALTREIFFQHSKIKFVSPRGHVISSIYEPSGPWSRRLSPVSVVLSGWESLTPPGRDTNPSQVSSQQTLVLIYLPREDGKLSWLKRKRRSHKYSNFSKVPGIELGTLWLESRDLTNCANHVRLQPRPPSGPSQGKKPSF